MNQNWLKSSPQKPKPASIKKEGKNKPSEKSRPDPKLAPDIRMFFKVPKLSPSLSEPDQIPGDMRELPGNPTDFVYTCTQPQNGGKRLIPGDDLNSE